MACWSSKAGVAPFVVSLEMASQPQVEIVGDRGRLEIAGCFTPGRRTASAGRHAGGKREERLIEAANSYLMQGGGVCRRRPDGR